MSSTADYREADDGGLVPIRNSFLMPTAKLDDQKFEFYFLLDVSGSMNGQPAQLAARALSLFLQSLPADCYFNVLAFDHTFTYMFPRSVKYSQQTLQDAKTKINGLHRGGYDTNIYSPLQYIYGQPQFPGYLTQIFTITDGGVANRDAVLNLVRDKVKHSRSFAMGIGNSVDRLLVSGIAENAGGMAEFVADIGMMQSKILNQLKIALKPALLKPIRDASASKLIPMY